jgi:hypothetical protein
MKRPARTVLLLLWIGGIASTLTTCSPYRVEYMENSLRETTQAELIHKFGYPQRLKRVKNGDTIWEYDFQGKGSECASYILTFNSEELLRHWERRDCPQEHPGSHPPK